MVCLLTDMSISINCNFARVVLTLKHTVLFKKVPLKNVHKDFQQQFIGYDKLDIDLSTAKKRFPELNRIYSRHWTNDTARLTYEAAFGEAAWLALSEEEKRKHSLRDCNGCATYHSALSALFPAKDAKAKVLQEAAGSNAVTITLGPEKLTAKKIGKQIVK